MMMGYRAKFPMAGYAIPYWSYRINGLLLLLPLKHAPMVFFFSFFFWFPH